MIGMTRRVTRLEKASSEAAEGFRSEGTVEVVLEMPRAPSGLRILGCFPRVNPGLCSPDPSGQRPDSTYPKIGKCPNASPGTSSLATIIPSLPGENTFSPPML
jgi:hypothetical protein